MDAVVRLLLCASHSAELCVKPRTVLSFHRLVLRVAPLYEGWQRNHVLQQRVLKPVGLDPFWGSNNPFTGVTKNH